MRCGEMLGPEEMERALRGRPLKWRRWHICAAALLNNAFLSSMKRKNNNYRQMFMLLTANRLASKCVVTGDVTQIDCPAKQTLRRRRSIAGI